jgi:hypothetical protein
MAAEISPDAQKILATATPEAQAYVTANAPGGKVTSGEASRLLSTFNATKATPADVFSQANVAQTLTNPAQPYDYSDPLKLRERINTELGLSDVEKQYQDAINKLRAFDTGTTTQQFNIEQELNPMGVIRGEQATALGQRSLSRQGFADTAQALADRYNALSAEATNKFNILNAERSTLQNLMVNNPGAGITYLDTVDQAAKKIENFRLAEEKRLEKLAEEKAKEEYKKNLKATAMQLGISTKSKKGGSLKTKDLEKAIAKFYGDKAATDKLLQDLEIESKRIANSTARSGGGGTVGERQGAALANAQDALLASRGTDGKVDPGVYTQQRAAYVRSGGTISDFDSQFGGLLSSQEQDSLGIQIGTAAERNAQLKLEEAQKAAQSQAQSALDAVNDLEKMNISGAVGAKGLSSLFGYLDKPIAGTKAASARAQIDRVKALVTLPELQNLRGLGAMSDREFATLTSAASALSTDMKEKDFKAELSRIKSVLQTAIGRQQSGDLLTDEKLLEEFNQYLELSK